MKILILEGIASSGKTTVENLLLDDLNALRISEDETLLPIMGNRDPEVAIKHLKTFFERIDFLNTDVLILDRFHLTHAFRTGVGIESFKEIEEWLAERGAQLVLLTMEPDAIQGRIEATDLHRGDSWALGKKGAIEDRVKYYKEQQEILKALELSSVLRSMVIDTTNQDWGATKDKVSEFLAGER